jgi:hypothetical protein
MHPEIGKTSQQSMRKNTMKALSVLSLILCVACSPARSLNRTAAPQSAKASIPAAEKAAAPKSLPILEEKQVESVIASQETIAAEPVNVEAAPEAEVDMSEQVREVFASAQSSQGKQLSAEQIDTLTDGFMNFVTVAQSKKPAKTAEAWNQLMASIQDMNGKAKAQNAGGLIGDILDLALDLIDLAGDLIAAVLQLDVAGVLDVALDLIDLIIDFLV